MSERAQTPRPAEVSMKGCGCLQYSVPLVAHKHTVEWQSQQLILNHLRLFYQLVIPLFLMSDSHLLLKIILVYVRVEVTPGLLLYKCENKTPA